MKRFLFAMAVVVVGATLSCSPVVPDRSVVVLDVTKLDAPAAISAGGVLTVVLTVTSGGCVTFDHISMVRDLSGASLTAWGRDSRNGEMSIPCTANIVSDPHSFEIGPPFQNSFTVQVPRGRMSPLTTTVQVQ